MEVVCKNVNDLKLDDWKVKPEVGVVNVRKNFAQVLFSNELFEKCFILREPIPIKELLDNKKYALIDTDVKIMGGYKHVLHEDMVDYVMG